MYSVRQAVRFILEEPRPGDNDLLDLGMHPIFHSNPYLNLNCIRCRTSYIEPWPWPIDPSEHGFISTFASCWRYRRLESNRDPRSVQEL